MKKFLLLISLLFLLSLHGCQETPKEPKEIYENQPNYVFLMDGESSYYKYKASVSLIGRSVAIFTTPLLEKSDNGKLDYFISFNSTPATDNHEIRCLGQNIYFMTACLINFSNKTDQTVEVNILTICRASNSSNTCSLKFRLAHDNEIFLKYNQPELYSFDRDESNEIFSFSVPNKTDFHRIVFTIKYKNLMAATLYEKRENAPSETIFFSEGSPKIIQHGYSTLAIFQKDDKYLCSNCNISIFMSCQRGTVIELSLTKYEERSVLRVDYEYFDYIFTPKKSVVYKLSLLEGQKRQILNKNFNKKLFFTLSSITGGEKTLFMNFDSPADFLNNYAFNSSLSEYYNEEDIIITNNEITEYKAEGDNFYLAVYADSPGAYKLQVKLVDTFILKLSLGIREISSVIQDEIDNYELEIYEGEDEISIKVLTEKGNVDVYGKICELEKECQPITASDISLNQHIDFKSENEGNDIINLPPCPNKTPFCYVMIAVKGHSITTNYNRYSILAASSKGIISLLENVNQEVHIDAGKQKQFKLHIDDSHNDVDLITLKITEDLLMDVSKDNECMDRMGECSMIRGDGRHPVSFTKDPLRIRSLGGDYFVIITALKSSNFFINAEVKRKNNIIEPIKLSEGKLYREILTPQNKKVYFQFHVHVLKSTKLDINLQGDSKKFQIYVCDDDELPSEKHHTHFSKDNYLRIENFENDEEKFYTIMVTLLDQNSFNEHSKDLSFSVIYSTELTIKTIEKNNPFYDTIAPNSCEYYMFFVDTQEKVNVNKHIINPTYLGHHLDFMISKNPFPNLYSFDYKMLDHEQSKITLGKKEITDLCGESNTQCPIYLTVSNTYETTPIIFNVLIQIKTFSVQLLEGLEQKFTFDQEDESFQTYFIPPNPNKTYDIYIYSQKEQFETYLSIHKDERRSILTPLFDEDFPNQKKHELKLDYNFKQAITIDSKRFSSCWPHCVVLLRVNFPVNRQKSFPLYFLISSDLNDIYEGKPLLFSLDRNSIKFYELDLTNFIKQADPKSSISISLIPFYGDGEIFVNIAYAGHEEKPTNIMSDFTSFADVLEITYDKVINKIPASKRNATSKNYLIIGIYAYNVLSKFLLHVQTSALSLTTVFLGTPLNVKVKSDEVQLFRFYNSNSEKFKIYFNRESGLGSISAIPCNPQFTDENTLEKCINKNSSYSLITGTASSLITISKQNNVDLCQHCYIAIKIKGASDLKGSLVVSDENNFIDLPEGKQFYGNIEHDEQSLYELWGLTYEDIEIVVTVLSGDPVLYFSYDRKTDKREFPISMKKDNNSLIYLKVPHQIVKDEEDPNQDNVQLFRNYYLLVHAGERAEYQISYISTRFNKLSSGAIKMDYFRANNRKIYTFANTDNDQKLVLNINTIGNFINFLTIHITLQERQKDNYDGNNLHDIYMSIEPSFKSNSSISYQLPNQTGLFLFSLDSESDQDFNFTISVGGRDVSILPYDFSIQSKIESYKSIYYEMFIPRRGYLVIELTECYGDTFIFVTQDYKKLIKEEFENAIKSMPGQTNINVIKVEKGPFYLILKSGKGITIYDLNSHFYDLFSEIPYNRLSVNKDSLHYSYNNEMKQFEIFVVPIQCVDCNERELKSSKITYTVMLGINEDILDAACKCGIDYLQSSETFNLSKSNYFSQKIVTYSLFETNSSKYLNLSLKMDSNHDSYYVGVKAVVDYIGDKKNATFYYPTLKILAGSSNEGFLLSYLVLILVFFLVSFCILFGAYFYGKYAKIKKKLLSETGDTLGNITEESSANRTVDQLNQSIEMENKKYQGMQNT